MSIGGGPKIPPQGLDLERQTRGMTALRPWTRRLLYAALGAMAIFVVVGIVWILVG